MELTRRDAAAALAVLGAGGAVGLATREWGPGDDSDEDPADDTDEDLADDRQVRDVLVAVAEVVYPSAVTGTAAFVESVLAGRLDREDHAEGLRETVGEFDEVAVEWYGDRVPDLALPERDRLLREVGADTADADPAGTTAERVRYYVVNELLLALYASPKGGKLVGIENPRGHPGGIATYQRGPPS